MQRSSARPYRVPDLTSCSALEPTLSALDHGDAKVRLALLRELCPCHVKRNVPEIWDRLLHLVHDPDVKVRSTVLHILADGSPRERVDEVVWAIGTLVNDPDLRLRRRARRVMEAYRRTQRVNVL